MNNLPRLKEDKKLFRCCNFLRSCGRSVSVSVCQCICLCVWLCVGLSVWVSVCLSVCLTGFFRFTTLFN